MLIIRLLRFLRGYVCFRAAEGFPERFLNLCNRQSIPVWDVVCRDGALTGRTTIRGYKAMHDCAERSGAVLGMEEKRGLPFFLYAYRKRAGLLLGLVMFLCGLQLLSGMVWSIEVTGNESVSKERILQVLEEQGLYQGSSVKGMDAAHMGERALAALPELQWLALNLRGSTAVIEVRERLPEAPDEETAAQNIVAGKAGQLAVLEVYTGSPQAKTGQAVAKGDLLAGGIIDNKDGSARLAAATAYAVARTPLALSVSLPRAAQPTATEPTAQKAAMRSHYTLRFLWLRIPLGPRPEAAQEEVTLVSGEVWAPGGKPMPLALERMTILSGAFTAIGETDETLVLAAAERFFDTAFDDFRGVQVLEQAVSVDLTAEWCHIALEGVAFENIGRAVDIATDDSQLADASE